MGILARVLRVLLPLLGTMLATASAADAAQWDAAALAPLDAIVENEIQLGHIPGAVVVIGKRGKILYRRAFGNRTLTPAPRPMTADTVFDLASLTKAVATATAVMQLVEQGKLRLDAPVARYWPAFQANGKSAITVRQLLTHTSGLRADLDLQTPWAGYRTAMQRIVAERLATPSGHRAQYSDINFAVLGELVRRVSGLPLKTYCQRHIFDPLGMRETRFLPSNTLRQHAAPTGFRNGQPRQGEVHDPTAQRMGGVAGHAGLFSTADDLAVFAQAILDGGIGSNGKRILRAETIARLILPQDLADPPPLRGLGWRIDPPFAANRDELPAVGAISHYGYTGTALWIDPVTQTFVIVLSNRVHPDGRGDAMPLRRQIAAAVGKAAGPLSFAQIVAAQPTLAPYAALPPLRSEPLPVGIDVLAADDFTPLAGRRIGLITNHSGVDAAGHGTLDLLRQAPGLDVVAVFSPEHGLYGDRDARIASGTDRGLTVFSLYGDTLRPTPAMLQGIDTLVFDIQDAGARFYTYITTMAYAMEAAAARGISFYVLDRPNPLGGEAVQGPLLDADRLSFTGYFPLPVRHGMTVGELARMFNAENHIGADLHVVAMRGYRRNEWYDQTARRWIAPSPNLRTLTAATLYPGLGLIEGTNVSVGRGTPTPFELVGAPWIDGTELARRLNARDIPGVFFEAAVFTPKENRFRQQPCHGIRVRLLDRQSLDSPLLGIELAHALYSLYPETFQLDRALGSIGAHTVLEAIRAGKDPRDIAAAWQAPLAEFRQRREKYLLY